MTASRKLSLYLKGVSAGTAAMMVNLVSGLAGLWLMTQILDKEAYGALALAQAWILFVSLLSTLGLDRTLMYRVAALERVESRLVGGDLATSVLLIVLISGITLAGLTLTAVAYLDSFFDFNPIWFYVFGVTVPFTALVAVLTAWQTANDRAHVAQVLSPGTSVIRTLLLLAAWIVMPENAGVAIAVIGGAVLSIFLWIPFVPRGSLGSFRLPSREDWSYGLKLLFTRAAQDGILRVDIIMLGFFVNSAIVAEYSVAKRLAELAQIGNRLMSPVFTPRMRYALATGDTDGLSHEYRQNRFVSGLAALMLLAVYYIVGEPVLDVFGDYRGAWPVLLILVAGYLISSLYGATGRYLNMAGYASLTLYTTLALLVFNILLNAMLIPPLSSIGAALATATALLTINAFIVYLIWTIDRFQTLSLALTMAIASVFLGAWSWAVLPAAAPFIIAICIGLTGVFFLVGERYIAKTVLFSAVSFVRPRQGMEE